MAFIDDNTKFDADQIPSAVVGIAAEVGKHDSGLHQHNKGQLLYAPSGCMTVKLEGAMSILPPTKAMWIPPQTEHQAIMTNVVAYRSIYFDCHAFDMPNKVSVIDVNALLKALIDKIAMWPWDKPRNETVNSVALFWEEFNQAKKSCFTLPIPKDRRLNKLAIQLTEPTYQPPQLNDFAQTIGASTKTITRIFKQQTGMGYQEWRQQWRLIKAIELLSQGLTVSDVGHHLEFSSDSAFIAFFKKQVGAPPLSFMQGK